MKKKKGIRIDQWLIQEIEGIAMHQSRTFSNMVEFILKKYLGQIHKKSNIVEVLQEIRDNLKKNAKSKLINLSETESINIDNIARLEHINKKIKITLRDGGNYTFDYSKEDWDKLHRLVYHKL